jgi:hypothetical protein
MFGGYTSERDSWTIRYGAGSVWSKSKSMKWSDRDELVLERSLEPLVVLINMYKDRYGMISSRY